jgi:hypothetical protein
VKFWVEIRLEETKQLVACTRQTEQPNGGGGERNKRDCRRKTRRVGKFLVMKFLGFVYRFRTIRAIGNTG